MQLQNILKSMSICLLKHHSLLSCLTFWVNKYPWCQHHFMTINPSHYFCCFHDCLPLKWHWLVITCQVSAGKEPACFSGSLVNLERAKWYDGLELRLGEPEDGWVLFCPNSSWNSSVTPIKAHPTQKSYTSYKFSIGIVTLPAIFYLLIFMHHSPPGTPQTSNTLVCFRTCLLGNSDKGTEKVQFNYP